jgi:hypothetical protein
MVRYRQRLDERETRVARHDIEASDIAYFYLKLLPKWSQLSVCLPGRDRFHKWLWVAYCILIALMIKYVHISHIRIKWRKFTAD